jgi:hypothetical protein
LLNLGESPQLLRVSDGLLYIPFESVWRAGENEANYIHLDQIRILTRGKREISVVLNYCLGFPFIGHENPENTFESICIPEAAGRFAKDCDQ